MIMWTRSLRDFRRSSFPIRFCFAVVALVAIYVYARAQAASSAVPTLPVEAADRFADGIASVNAPLCKSAQALGPGETVAARAEWAYLTGYHFRHVRDGFLTCYNQAAFAAAWKRLALNGSALLATELFSYTDDDLRNARTLNAGLEAISSGNEWDSEKSEIRLGADAAVGDAQVATTQNALASHMVTGQTYRFMDDQPETFQLTAPTGRSTGAIASPLRYPHTKGARIARVGDFVTDVDAWLAYYAPRIKRYQPTFPILGASLAFPIHANAFSEPTDRTDGRYGLDAVEEHGYPAPMSSNPEGPDGDGGRSYIAIDHPPCSIARTSYSVGFNTCEAKQQTGRSDLPIWDTEYSYTVVGNQDGPLPDVPHPTPDRIGITYLARSEFFLASNGRSRVYWFQMLDGTSGPTSGFCSYGLIFTGQCADHDHLSQPVPKGEMLALGNLIRFFADPACPFPKCVLTPPTLALSWSDPSLPLNASAFAWKSGKLAIVSWLGSKSYDFQSTGDCVRTSSCDLIVTPRAERLTSAAFSGARDIEARTLDTNPNDPAPPNVAVASADGSEQNILACPAAPKRNFYGCLTIPKRLEAHGRTLSLNVTDVPTIVTFRPQKT